MTGAGRSRRCAVRESTQPTRLFESAGVAATPMDGWGERHGAGWLRFVFANEPVERIRGCGALVMLETFTGTGFRSSLSSPNPVAMTVTLTSSPSSLPMRA